MLQIHNNNNKNNSQRKKTGKNRTKLAKTIEARKTSERVSGIMFSGKWSKLHWFNIGNELDLAQDVTPVLYLDVIP